MNVLFITDTHLGTFLPFISFVMMKAHEAVAHQIKSPEENPRLCSSRS